MLTPVDEVLEGRPAHEVSAVSTGRNNSAGPLTFSPVLSYNQNQTHLNNTSTSPAGTTLTAHTSRGSETHHSHPQCKVCVPRHPTQ